MSSLLRFSIDASLFIQIVTLVLNLFAFLIPIDKWDFALKEILGLETAVQIVELAFYTWYRQHIVTKVSDITQFRYYDWFVTTPTMLFSTAAYYGYLDNKESEQKEPFSVWSFFQQNANWVWLMFFMNALMLLFGYLQEIGMLSIVWSSILGYAGLLGSFGILYKQFVSKTPQQQGLFWFMFIAWSLYGIAAMLPSVQKNISYNILDIFAKNFYGLFLGYLIVSRRQN
jgi:bacteriorhodopsin